jgi:D-alanyl-D-alanine carboxypeptidase
MYRTPHSDDELPDNSPARVVYPRQRRKQPVPPRRLPVRYRDYDTPELPIVRRASLFIDQEQVQSEPTEIEAEVEIIEDSEYDEDIRAYEHNSRQKRTSYRRRSLIHEPDVPLEDLPNTPLPRYAWTKLSRLNRNPTMLIIGLFLLAIVILTPIVVYSLRAQTHLDVVNNMSGGASSSSVLPTNPHELIITPLDTNHPAPPVYATAAYLLDADTGATLYARNPFMHLPMLSTTKLMTAVLAVEQGNPDQMITITPAIYNDVNQLSGDSALFGLKKGETYSLRDLLYGLLLVSGNDAAIAIACTIGGNLPHFVAEMNRRAQQLGMYDTHYMNPHGLLQEGQYSSAHDLAILARYAFSISLIHQISGTEQYHITKTTYHAEHWVINGNQFLWWYPGVDAGKTGYDGQYNFVQVMSVTRNHHHLIAVTIHTVDWWTDMRDLMNWGFNSFQWVSPYDVDFQHPIPYDYLWNYFTGDKKVNTIPTANQGRYYIYTGFSVSGPILKYFDSGGGLKKFGYPESMATVSSTLMISQTFDHATIQCDLTTKQCSSA